MNTHQTNKQKNNRQLAQTFIAKVIVYEGARRKRKENKVSAFFLSMWSLFQRKFPGVGHERNSVDAILNPGNVIRFFLAPNQWRRMKKVSLILLRLNHTAFEKNMGPSASLVRQLLTRQIVNRATDIVHIILLFDFGIYKFSIYILTNSLPMKIAEE